MEFIVPSLALILTSAGIYFDFHGSKGKKKWGVGAFLVLVLGSMFFFDIQQRKNNKTETESRNDNTNEMKASIDGVDYNVAQIKEKFAENKETIDGLKKELESIRNFSIDQAVLDQARQEIRTRRNKISIYYYLKNSGVDENFKFHQLEKLTKENYWFKGVEKKPCEPDCSKKTNSIMFGSNVKDIDVKIIAKELINSGLNTIKLVAQSHDPDKKNLVVISYNYYAETVCEDIWKATSFDTSKSEVKFSRVPGLPDDKKDFGCRQ